MRIVERWRVSSKAAGVISVTIRRQVLAKAFETPHDYVVRLGVTAAQHLEVVRHDNKVPATVAVR